MNDSASQEINIENQDDSIHEPTQNRSLMSILSNKIRSKIKHDTEEIIWDDTTKSQNIK